MKMLFHIATGPENPTRLSLGLLVARTARAEGHEVDVFLAGDAVHVLHEVTRAATNGVGTGNVAEHWAALVESGARMFGSLLSAQARVVDAPDGFELVLPPRLVQLIAEADRVICY